ncbi:hypothetical protein [uncultured Devosia sp.]|uniref:hypothetical protein n=1 Tax=uncultured Devosia sp. TaxID=211434 RepID=UPI00261470D9|nr:hypothetical protein [uncultured Devosia sp.]
MHLSASDNVIPLDPAEPGIHPIAAKMRDIILGKAADGEPTTEDDLADFTIADIKTHFPAARAAANKIVVRQVDDPRGFETRQQLLSRATECLLRRMPGTESMRQALSAMGLHKGEIDDLWPDLMPTLADAFLRMQGQVH